MQPRDLLDWHSLSRNPYLESANEIALGRSLARARLALVGQGNSACLIGCMVALACSGQASHDRSGDPPGSGASSGGSAQSSGGNAQQVGGSASDGGSHAGTTPAGGMNAAGVLNVGGVPACPPPTPTNPNPAGCPANKPMDLQAVCELDSALLCSFWEPTQNVCPQSSLLPTHFRCCEGQWLVELGSFNPTLSCTNGAGGDSPGAGGGP